MKFGANLIRERYKDFEGGGASGVFGFSNLTTSQPDSASFNQWGSSFASFLLGDVNNTNTTTISDYGWRINYQSFFLQDEWRATSRLTVFMAFGGNAIRASTSSTTARHPSIRMPRIPRRAVWRAR